MIHIAPVDLSSRNVVLPRDRVGMVVVQPFLDLTTVEPFRCTEGSKPSQLVVVEKTLEISRAAHHGAEKTHFTIFPEYAIPGLDGIALIQRALEATDWPTGTIIIGGTDALSKPEFATLANGPSTHLDTAQNALERIPNDAWINCKITWVKGSDGQVERWLQPKVAAAWPELDVSCQQMFRGSSVFAFKGPFNDQSSYYRFCSLVCFDWIAAVSGKKVWHWVLEELHNQATSVGGEFSLSWFFVVQHNRKPSHHEFLAEIPKFFDQTVLSNIRRERACLVFANSAGQSGLGKADEYGQSSLLFPPQTLFEHPACSPTFSNGGSRFRSSAILNTFHDVLFRERGACIHSFVQVNPNTLVSGASGRTIAVEKAAVFPLNGTMDRRAPSGPVPACTKWLNDELDAIPKLSTSYPTAALAGEVEKVHRQTVAALREIQPQATLAGIKLAAQQSSAKHADDWTTVEVQALENLVNTLNIISLGSPTPAVGTDPFHATFTLTGQDVDLVVIRGESHEKCHKHASNVIPKPRRPLLVVSRDLDNNLFRRRDGSFLKTEATTLDQEAKITDPASGSFYIGYRNLLDVFQKTNTVNAVPGAIHAELAA